MGLGSVDGGGGLGHAHGYGHGQSYGGLEEHCFQVWVRAQGGSQVYSQL